MSFELLLVHSGLIRTPLFSVEQQQVLGICMHYQHRWPFCRWRILFLWRQDSRCWRSHQADQSKRCIFPVRGEEDFFFILKAKEHILDLFRHKYTYIGESPHTLLSGSTMMAFSSSSETSTQEVKEDLIMLMTKSLDKTSSFFTWSPVTLVLPAMPYLQSTNTNLSLWSYLRTQ